MAEKNSPPPFPYAMPIFLRKHAQTQLTGLSLLLFVDQLLSGIKIKIGAPLCLTPAGFVNVWNHNQGVMTHTQKQPGIL